MQIRAVGIPWYRREDYPALLRLFVDRDRLPARFDDWLQRAEQTLQSVQAGGQIAEKVYLDPAEFSRWCGARGLDIDSDARMAFANEAVALKYRNQS
mgnify:FL=1